MPNVLSPRDLDFRPDKMGETVQHTHTNLITICIDNSNQSLLSRQNVCIPAKETEETVMAILNDVIGIVSSTAKQPQHILQRRYVFFRHQTLFENIHEKRIAIMIDIRQ